MSSVSTAVKKHLASNNGKSFSRNGHADDIDGFVTSISRGNNTITARPDDVLSGDMLGSTGYALLREHINTGHPRSAIVSDEATRVAVCRLPAGKTIEIAVTYNEKAGGKKEILSLNTPGFCKICDDQNVDRAVLANPKGIALNFKLAQIRSVNKENCSDGNTIISANISIEGKRHVLRTSIFPLNCGTSAKHQCKSASCAEFDTLDYTASPGWRTFWNKVMAIATSSSHDRA